MNVLVDGDLAPPKNGKSILLPIQILCSTAHASQTCEPKGLWDPSVSEPYYMCSTIDDYRSFYYYYYYSISLSLSVFQNIASVFRKTNRGKHFLLVILVYIVA